MFDRFLVPLRTAVATATLAALAACSTSGGGAPGAQFAWFDLVTSDVSASAEFYEALFGWEVTAPSSSDDFGSIKLAGTEIGGVSQNAGQQANGATWIAVLAVSNADGAAQQATDLGGTLVRETETFDDGSVAAVVTDPQGALLALYQDNGSGGRVPTNVEGSWVWTDLFTSDIAGARDFYRNFLGFEASVEGAGEETGYFVFVANGAARGGLVQLDQPIPPRWLPYVGVGDINATAARAEQLGAEVIARTDDAVILVDPLGAAFGLRAPRSGGRS